MSETKKTWMLCDYTLNNWRRSLQEAMKLLETAYWSTAQTKVEAIEHQMAVFQAVATEVKVEHLPDATKLDVVKALGLDNGHCDTALPQQWVDDVHYCTGESPVTHFVWDCNAWAPIPLTEIGETILRIYKHVKEKMAS